MTKKTEKSIFIRCSKETFDLAHALKDHENRSLNKQMIHMIHAVAKEKGVEAVNTPVSEEANEDILITNCKGEEVEIEGQETKVGLIGLLETKKQGFRDR